MVNMTISADATGKSRKKKRKEVRKSSLEIEIFKFTKTSVEEKKQGGRKMRLERKRAANKVVRKKRWGVGAS